MSRKRQIKKSFWIDEEENEKLKIIVSKTCKTESDLFRDLINGNSIKEKPDEQFYESIKELRLLSRQLEKLSQNENNNLESNKLNNDIENLDKLILNIKQKYLL